MTLITIGNSEAIVGRCNARCYRAKHKRCKCICGGRNHGVGLVKALENVDEIAAEWGRLTLSTYEGEYPHPQGRLPIG